MKMIKVLSDLIGFYRNEGLVCNKEMEINNSKLKNVNGFFHFRKVFLRKEKNSKSFVCESSMSFMMLYILSGRLHVLHR